LIFRTTWRRHDREESWRRNHDSWRRYPGGGIMRRNDGTQAPRHPGGTQEAPGRTRRDPGSIQEACRRTQAEVYVKTRNT